MRYWFLPAILTLFGLLSILTLSSIAPELAARQLSFFVVGAGIFWSISRLSWKQVQSLSPIGYVVTLFFLVLTLLIALQTRNTARWISIGGLFALQASQLAVPLVGLYLSTIAQKMKTTQLPHFLKLIAIISIPGLLILIEPDLGTTIVYLLSVLVIFLFIPTNKRHIFSLITLGLVGMFLSWSFVLKPYQKQRLTSFAQPTKDTQGASYNANQAMIAVGSGQIWGRGLGEGSQSHLRFLPERQTDFIFASIAEEFGFLGSTLIIFLYLMLVLFLVRTALIASNTAIIAFIFSTVTVITLQTFVNIGMNMGLLPITGITLPLLSYGGSSILTLCGTFGIIQSALLEQKKELTLHFS